MSAWICWSLLVVLTLLVPGFGYSDLSNNNSILGCSSAASPTCLKCGPRGCIKCPGLITHPSRQCVSSCPYGYTEKWSTYSDYMGRICAHSGGFLGLTPGGATIMAGIFAGTALCALLITSTILYVRVKRRSLPQSVETGSDLDDSPERRDFVKQLETLRPYAQTYLDMLNDTRRQLREALRSGDNSAMAAYKPVVRDLAKILLLLNRNVDRMSSVPEDWEHLFSWAEKALKRYKRMSDVSQPPVGQLINFLQGPGESQVDFEPRTSTTMSTFKPDQVFGGSTRSLGQFGADLEASLNPQWKFEYSLVDSAVPTSLSQFDPTIWKNSKEYLNSSVFLEDDFCQLGFRPQDEITTEL